MQQIEAAGLPTAEDLAAVMTPEYEAELQQLYHAARYRNS